MMYNMRKGRYGINQLLNDVYTLFNIVVMCFTLIMAIPLLIIGFCFIMFTRPFREWWKGVKWRRKQKLSIGEIKNKNQLSGFHLYIPFYNQDFL